MMSHIRLSNTTYEKCKNELIKFRNANRDTERNEAYFDWRYLGRPNKFKPIIVWAESSSGEKIGLSSLISHNFMVNNAEKSFGILGDISVSKDWRGKGIAQKMFRFLNELEEVKELKLCFVLPNTVAEYPLLKAGWHTIAGLARYVKIVNIEGLLIQWIQSAWLLKLISFPINIALRLLSFDLLIKRRSEYEGKLIDDFDDRFHELWESIDKKGIAIGFRNNGYLTWRYKQHHNIKYQIFTLTKHSRLCGYIIFYQREGICIIDDFLVQNKFVDYSYLLSLFIRYIRKGKIAATIWIRANQNTINPPFWIFGFIKRSDQQKCMIKSQEAVLNKQLIFNGQKWFLTSGDKDV